VDVGLDVQSVAVMQLAFSYSTKQQAVNVNR